MRASNGGGTGLAVCQDLGLLVISACDKLHVFALPNDIARGDLGIPRELELVRTLGGVAPMEFQFDSSGNMAFTDCGVSTRNLLVVDLGKSGWSAVHVVDVVHGVHVGYVAAPGCIKWPGAVATRNSQAAVCCTEKNVPAVRLFENSGGSHTWTAVRVIACGFNWPCGLRFAADGVRLVVANGRGVSMFCAKDGAFLRRIALQSVYPMDVMECAIKDGDGSRAGWVMSYFGGLVAVADNANARASDVVARRREFDLLCLALVPGLGLVARHEMGVRFFATPDSVAMASMSACKVAWMVSVRRAIVSRRF